MKHGVAGLAFKTLIACACAFASLSSEATERVIKIERISSNAMAKAKFKIDEVTPAPAPNPALSPGLHGMRVLYGYRYPDFLTQATLAFVGDGKFKIASATERARFETVDENLAKMTFEVFTVAEVKSLMDQERQAAKKECSELSKTLSAVKADLEVAILNSVTNIPADVMTRHLLNDVLEKLDKMNERVSQLESRIPVIQPSGSQ